MWGMKKILLASIAGAAALMAIAPANAADLGLYATPLARVPVFTWTGCYIADDWGLAPVTLDQAGDLLEIVDDRHGRGSTIVTTQLPIEHWHEMIPNPTIADAILDRLVA